MAPPYHHPPKEKERFSTVTIMRATFLLHLLLPLLLATISSSASTTEAPRKALILAGWTPIKNISDPHVIEIGHYAVSEHNKEAQSNLSLSKVVKGETQVVSGVNYRLLLETKDGGEVASYEAVVWEKEWEKFRKLTSFKLVKS